MRPHAPNAAKKVRIVADTNIVVSAFLWGGVPKQVLAAVRDKRLTLYTSPALLAELKGILGRAKFAGKFAAAGESPATLLDQYRSFTQLVDPAVLTSAGSRDPDDDQVLACAVAAKAEAIVSGDADLLSLGTFQGIPILTATRMLERLNLRA